MDALTIAVKKIELEAQHVREVEKLTIEFQRELDGRRATLDAQLIRLQDHQERV